MNITYLRDAALSPRMDTLTYGELRDMLPEFTGKSLPRPERILADNMDSRFLAASDGVSTLTIFTSGLCLYEEPGENSVYPVSGCAGLEYNFVTGAERLNMETSGLLWYWPLLIEGKNRTDTNRDSRENDRIAIHYDSESIDWSTIPHPPAFPEELEEQAEKREHERNLHKRLTAAIDTLTAKQRRVLLLNFYLNMKENDIADCLKIGKSTVSITLRRAFKNLAKRI